MTSTIQEYHGEHQIKFTHNWNNKLFNTIFTTIRAYTKEKHEYYQKNLHSDFDVMIEGARFGGARLIGVHIKRFGDIDPSFLRVDTGIEDMEAIKALFKRFGIDAPDTQVLILTFARWQ